jgi:hypothetical protein
MALPNRHLNIRKPPVKLSLPYKQPVLVLQVSQVRSDILIEQGERQGLAARGLTNRADHPPSLGVDPRGPAAAFGAGQVADPAGQKMVMPIDLSQQSPDFLILNH